MLEINNFSSKKLSKNNSKKKNKKTTNKTTKKTPKQQQKNPTKKPQNKQRIAKAEKRKPYWREKKKSIFESKSWKFFKTS